MLQDTANEGYSTAHIAGTANQVDKTLDVLHKMIESGKKAAEVRVFGILRRNFGNFGILRKNFGKEFGERVLEVDFPRTQ